MKRYLIGLMILVLALAQPLGGALADAALSDVACPQQGFATKCDPGYSWAWKDGDGLYIYAKSEGSIPYVLIYWTRDGGSSHPETYFAEDYTPRMQAKYGDRLIDIGQYQVFSVAGVDMPGQGYTYMVDDTPVVMIRLLDLRWGGNVSYTVKYVQSDNQAALGALVTAVEYFRPDEAAGEPAGQAPSAPAGDLQGYSVTPSQPIVAGTANYSDGRFSIDLPQGWQILTTGEYDTFAFRAWDPDAPDRSIVFFSKVEPFHKSQAARDWFRQWGELGDAYYTMMGDCPVMEYLTVPCFLHQIGDVKALCQKYYASGAALDPAVVPVFDDLEVLETMPSSIPAPPTCGDNCIARISFRSERGAACEGLAAAQPTWMGDYDYDTGGVDILPYTVYNFMCVTAPVGELAELEPVLAQCLASFTFTDDYLAAARQAMQEETNASLAISRGMQSACDAYNAAWAQREDGFEIQSQKASDAALGYERLYDPDTHEVYRAETGFYDAYDLHRGEYGNPNLQRVDEGTSDYYLQGVDYYITH